MVRLVVIINHIQSYAQVTVVLSVDPQHDIHAQTGLPNHISPLKITKNKEIRKVGGEENKY